MKDEYVFNEQMTYPCDFTQAAVSHAVELLWDYFGKRYHFCSLFYCVSIEGSIQAMTVIPPTEWKNIIVDRELEAGSWHVLMLHSKDSILEIKRGKVWSDGV